MNRLNLLLTVLLFVSFAFSVRANEPQTQKGSKTIYVSLNSLTDLSFDDTYLGGIYFFEDRQGIDLEIGFLSNTNDVGGVETKTSSLYLSAGYINYVYQKGPVALYLIPYFAINTGSNDANNSETNGFEIALGIGAEWWAFENVSLSADVSIGYSSQTQKNTAINSEVKTTSLGFLSSGSGRFYLSFYF